MYLELPFLRGNLEIPYRKNDDNGVGATRRRPWLRMTRSPSPLFFGNLSSFYQRTYGCNERKITASIVPFAPCGVRPVRRASRKVLPDLSAKAQYSIRVVIQELHGLRIRRDFYLVLHARSFLTPNLCRYSNTASKRSASRILLRNSSSV